MSTNNFAKEIVEELYGEFDSEQHLKKSISKSFWMDSNDLLWKVGIIWNSDKFQFNRSFKAKLFVDTLMSIECALKSLIISLSKDSETPEEAYQTARRCGHDLEKLMDEVDKRSKHRLKFISSKEKDVIIEANDLGVHTRYDLDLFFMVFNDDTINHIIDEGKISSTIESIPWQKNFIELAHEIKSIAIKSIDRYFKNVGGYLGSDVSERDSRFTQFAQNAGFGTPNPLTQSLLPPFKKENVKRTCLAYPADF